VPGVTPLRALPLVAVLAVAAALPVAGARAATCDTTYSGPSGGAWTTDANWSGSAVPTSADNACVPGGVGTIAVPAGATAQAKGLTASSPLSIGAGATLTLNAASTLNGLRLDGGAVAGAGPVSQQGGTLSGAGTFGPSFLENGGTVAPGGEGVVGTLTFGSLFSQMPGATIDLDLASDSSYDQILPINNNAFFQGPITVTALGGYAPAVGTTWHVVSLSPGIQQLGETFTPSVIHGVTVSHGLDLVLLEAWPVSGGGGGTPPPGDGGDGGTTPTGGEPALGAPAAPAPAPVAPLTAPPLAAPAGLAAADQRVLRGCSDRRLVLDDVLVRGGRVALDGAAAPDLAGQKVTILLNDKNAVATATVGPDGRFATTAPLPAKTARTSNATRYRARIGTQKSLDLKLARRLVLAPPTAHGGAVALSGQVVAPLARPVAPVAVQQQTACGAWTTVKRFTPGGSGRFGVTVAAPEGAGAAIYRLSSAVRRTAANPKAYKTYSLPLPVRLG
jgi:hypothetical protein